MVTPSGNTAQALNDIFSESGDSINTISDLIGAVADVSGAIGVVGAVIPVVLALINAGQPDQASAELQSVLTAIQNDFHQLNQDLGASQILIRNTFLNGYISPAETQLQQLQSDIQAATIAPCITALDDLNGPVQPDLVWSMDYDWQIYWTDAGLYWGTCIYPVVGGGYQDNVADVGYGEQAPSRNADGTVFVYTFSLPLYLYAVFIFLAVAGSLDPNFTTNSRQTVLRPAAALLRSKHDQIVQYGLTQLTPPNWATTGLRQAACPGAVQGAATFGPGMRLIYSARKVVGVLIEYGAVEKFSGGSSIGSNYQININSDSDNYDVATFNKLQLRVLKRTKDVYVNGGLQRVWQVINQLNALVGDAPLPRPNFADWSFRQIVSLTQLLPTAVSKQVVSPDGTVVTVGGTAYSLRALARFIIQTQPFDTPYANASATVSFRQLLTNFPN